MKKIYLKFLCVFLLFGTIMTASAQERCHTDAYMQKRFLDDPELEKTFQFRQTQFMKQLNSRIACTSSDEVSIPLAFHFDNSVSCADEACILTAIQDQIEILNIGYGDNTNSPNAANCPAAYPDISSGTCITFYLAEPPACADQSTTACNAAITIGEFNNGGYANSGNGGAGTCWDDYLNVFILPNIAYLGVSDQIPDDLPPDGPGEGVTVISSAFGGLNGACAPFNTDNTYDQGKTLVHEIGHYLGLFHTFEGSCSDEPNNTYNGTPINVDDTPAQSTSFGGTASGCEASGCGGNQQTANFMNYTDDQSMDMFSEDQAFAQNFVALDLFGSLTIPAANVSNGDLFGLCPSGQCVLICPSSVTTPIAVVDDFCDDSGVITLSTAAIVLDEASDAVYTWSTGDYISNGGTAIASPTVGPITTTMCVVTSQVYYLNIDCGTTPLGTTLDGGTHTINVYPGPPADLSTLVTITGENTCNEPMVTAIPNCATFVTITSDPSNPSFPVAAGAMGTASYSLEYISDPLGPNCCASSMGGELLTNGDFESGDGPWTQVEEAPIGTPNPFGIIGTSGNVINGTRDAWFGGWGTVTGAGSVTSSYMTLTQSITLSQTCTTATLSFDYQTICDGNASITFNIIVGGVTVGTLDCSSGTGTFSVELIGAGVPSGVVDLVFESTEDDPNPRNFDDSGNVFMDNVSILEGNCPSTTCNLVVTADYDCSGVPGCTDQTAHNYDPLATTDDSSCETCSDGILNGDETEIDCGGSNPACPTCPCPTCYTDLTHGSACDLQTVESGTIDYESDNWISTSASTVIQNGAVVDYDATDYVEINGNVDHTFEVELGATFHMFIDGCGGSMIQSDKHKSQK